ncbi:MAG TPA: tripartite tricarboxylate transporter substrate binding protein [Burkholderiales bacterium]
MKFRTSSQSHRTPARGRRAFARRFAFALVAPLALALGAGSAQAYPDGPVTIVVAWPAGGATDLMARAAQDSFNKAIGGTSIIKNVVGAAGTIGAAEVAAAKPDGQSLLFSPIGPMVIQPQRMKLTYNPDSFEPICKISDVTVVLMSPPNSRFKTVADVIKEARAQDGKLPFASTGAGTIPHMAGIGFQEAAKVKLKHIPFKGSAAVIQAMLAGTVELFSDQPNLVGRYNMTPIAVYSANRLPEFKDTPTMKEAGFDLQFSIWNGLFAPKGTPEPVLAKLEAACKTTMTSPAVVDLFAKQAQPIHYLDRKGMRAFVTSEYKKATGLLEAAGLESK